MMKKIILAALGASVISTGVFASTSATGFYVEVNGGGVYTQIKEYFAQEKDSKDRIEILDASKKFAAYVGGGLGYGYEFANGFYVGVKVYGLYDATKVTKEAADETNVKNLKGTFGGKEETKSINGSYKIEYKPMFSYGAAIQAGYKVMPNFLVYASVGGEGTYTKAEQFVEFDTLVLKQGTSSLNYSTADGLAKLTATPASGGNEEMKVTTFSIVPGIGAKWFMTSNVFIGADVAFPIGFYKKVDKKYFDKAVINSAVFREDFNDPIDKKLYAKDSAYGSLNSFTLADVKLALQVKRNLNVRYGISVGYKF